MAEENKKTGPKMNPIAQEARELESTSKDALKNQGDYLNLLKDSSTELKKMIKSYETLQGKVSTLSQSTINIKELQKQINNLNVDRKNLTDKIAEIEKSGGTESIKKYQEIGSKIKNTQQEINALTEDFAGRVQKMSKSERERLTTSIQAKKDFIDSLKTQQEESYKTLRVDEQAYINRKQTLKLLEEQAEYIEEMLKNEQAAKENLGLSGGFAKILADKLGVGETVYSAMVERAKQLNGEEGKNMSIFGKRWEVLKAGVGAVKTELKNMWNDPIGRATILAAIFKKISSGITAGFNLAKQSLESLTGTGGPVSKFVSPFTDLIKNIPLVGNLLAGIVDATANLVDFATGANSETQKFARNLGISYQQSKQIENSFDAFSRSAGKAFITIEKLRKSQTELSSALGINNVFSKEILAADSQLAEQLGLELDTRKALAATTAITGQLQTKIFANIAAQTKVLSTNLGVNIRVQDTLKKAASFGGVLGLTFAKYPEKLTKSLLITKALGIDLEKINGIADSLLDFESSIASEFEAQLLTGKNISLAKARELALNNDLAGLAVEINNQLGSTDEFLNMNRIKQDAIAKAVGMSRDELADMLKQQQLFAAAGAISQKQFKENIKLMQERGTLQEDFLSKLSDEQAQLFLNSTATENIASFMDKLRQGFANLINNQTFKDFIDRIMNALSDPKFIDNIITKLTGFANLLIKITSTLLEGLGYIIDAADVLTGGFIIPNEVPETLKKIGADIGQVSIGKLVASNEVKNAVGTTQQVGAATNNSMMPSKQEIHLHSTSTVKFEGGTSTVHDDNKYTGSNMLPPEVKVPRK